MNAERLLALASRLLQLDKAIDTQNRYQQVQTHINNLAGQPHQVTFQTLLAQSLDELQAALQSIHDQLTPPERSDLEAIGGAHFFSPALVAGLRASMAANGMTPAVVRDEVNNGLTARTQFIDNVQQIKNRLEALGFKTEELRPFQAELGFLFPRDLFNDDLPGLVRELKQTVFVLNSFSEAATGTFEKIVVGQISTSDPIFFFPLSAETVRAVAEGLKFLVDAIKTGIDIRSLFHQSKKVGLEDDVLNKFETLIDKKIKEANDAAVATIMAKYPPGDGARRNEVENGLRISLEILAPRIERGLIIEIRQPPPELRTVPADAPDTEKRAAAAQNELAVISQQIEFPKLTGEPLLKLTHSTNDNPQAPEGAA